MAWLAGAKGQEELLQVARAEAHASSAVKKATGLVSVLAKAIQFLPSLSLLN